MERLLIFSRLVLVLLLAALTLSLVSCKKDSDSPTLIGTWKLVSIEGCFCPSGPVSDETLTLTATDYSFARDGQVYQKGTYAPTMYAKCGTTARVPALSFSDATNATPLNVPFTLDGRKLVLDYSNRCISDSPVKTYERLP